MHRAGGIDPVAAAINAVETKEGYNKNGRATLRPEHLTKV